MSSSKEITINYLKNIKRDYEHAYLEAVSIDKYSANTRIRCTLPLAEVIISLNGIIQLVEKNEGE